MTLRGVHRIHFIGIGGAGMSAIAKVLIERGCQVSGSDLKASRATALLQAMGATIEVGHSSALIDRVAPQLVVISSAIAASNPELQRAHEVGLPVVSRGQALADLLDGEESIVVAGTHGKTTTTSMIATAVRAAGQEPTYLIGAGLNDAGANARSGRGLAIAESDESDGSFLLLRPRVGVVTNLEPDHLDHWGSFQELEKAFIRFIQGVERAGVVVLPQEQPDLTAAAGGRRTVTFGDSGDVFASAARPTATGTRFTLHAGTEETEVELALPGMHNVTNALAATAACLAVGLSLAEIAAGLAVYRGVERRFELKGEVRGVSVVDDYAHHPTEIRATLAAARSRPSSGRIVAVFQPHRYSRTAALRREFGASFDAADRVVVTDVYGASEEPIPGVTGKVVAEEICARLPGRTIAYLPHRADVINYLEATTRPGDTVLVMGAGDVTAVGDELLVRLSPS